MDQQSKKNGYDFKVRAATTEDVAWLKQLIDLSVRSLQAGDYSAEQLEESLRSIYGVDTQLLADKTYFVVKAVAKEGFPPAEEPGGIVACGGWSKRRTLFGGDQIAGREDAVLVPGKEAAKIRAFFVHPDWARLGLGTLLLNRCEAAAADAGYTSFEMGATLTGVSLYRVCGYNEIGRIAAPMKQGLTLEIVRMRKDLQLPKK